MKQRGKKILEGIDRVCSAMISTAWLTLFGSIASDGQASDLDAITIPYSNGTKLPVIFPLFFGALAVRTVIGVVQTVITVKEGRQRIDELPDNDEEGAENNVRITEETVFTTLRVGSDLFLARLVPGILVGIIAFSDKEPAYLLLAAESSVAVKQLLQMIFNSCILAGQEPENRKKFKYLAEPSVGLLTTISLIVVVDKVFADQPDDPSSGYTSLGMGVAGAQILVHTVKLGHLLCCSSSSIVEPGDFPEYQQGLPVDVEGVGGEEKEERKDQQGEQDQGGRLVQSASMFQGAMGTIRGLFRARSGMGLDDDDSKRYATLQSARNNKEGDVVLTTFSGAYLGASPSGRKLVESKDPTPISVRVLPQYGAIGHASGGLNLQEQGNKTMVVQNRLLNSMWQQATKPGGVAPGAGRGDGGVVEQGGLGVGPGGRGGRGT